MSTRPSSASRSTRLAAATAALVAAGGLLLAPGRPAMADAPPPNPTDQQLNSAQSQKDSLAGQVGDLSGKVTQIQSQLSSLRLRSEVAEQKLADALDKLQKAKDAATTAKQQVTQAQQQVNTAQQQFSQYIHDTYMAGSVGGVTGSLLTASDPSAMLERSTLENYVASNHLDALGDLDRATVAKSNADAAARLAVANQTDLATQAQDAETAARAAVAAASAQSATLNAQLTSAQGQLSTAQATLATLTNQRVQYNAYVAEQARIAAEKAREEAAAAAAAARLRQQQQSHSSGSGSGGGGGGGGGVSTPAPPAAAPNSGGWTPQEAATAVARARQYLGWPYAWAAGNANGPTYGHVYDSSTNDSGVYGFDCSGLMMYAWGPYIHMAHFAATQYVEAGSYHPSVGQLLPGDMVFWSDDGTIGGIGHVAIYIGGGDVIQAPYSGAYIEITPLDQVDYGYFGATRPLT